MTCQRDLPEKLGCPWEELGAFCSFFICWATTREGACWRNSSCVNMAINQVRNKEGTGCGFHSTAPQRRAKRAGSWQASVNSTLLLCRANFLSNPSYRVQPLQVLIHSLSDSIAPSTEMDCYFFALLLYPE